MASLSSLDLVQVLKVNIDGSNIAYRAEVEAVAFNSSGEMVKRRFEINVEGGDVENCDEIAVDFVGIDGSNIAYRAEVEARAYNCSGGIVERLFEIYIEGGEGESRNVVAGVARVQTEIGEDSDFHAGTAAVSAIRAINKENINDNVYR